MYDGLLRVLGVAGRGLGRKAKGRRRGEVVARAVEALEGRTLMSAGGYTAIELTPDVPAFSGPMVTGTLPSGTIYGSYTTTDTNDFVDFAYRVSEGRSVKLGFSPWGATAGGDVYGNALAVDGSGWHGYAYFDATGQVADLGTLGGTQSEADGGLAGGKIYGTSTTADDAETHLFLYDGASGVMSDLGGLGGKGGYVGATAAGDLYGTLGLADGTSHGFVYLAAEGRLVDVGTLGGATSGIGGVLPSGLFYGSSDTAADGGHAFLFDPKTGVRTDLGGLGGSFSSVYGALPSGDLWGFAQGADGGYRSVVYHVATGEAVAIGTLGGTFSSVDRVLPSGDLAGEANLPGDAGRHAVIYDVDRGELIDLGTLGGTNSSVSGVLPSGDVYGWSETADGNTHGFLYNVAAGRMIDVSLTSGYSSIESVTHSGDLYGYADPGNGLRHAFVYHRATGVSEDLGTLGGSESYSTGPYIGRTGVLPGYASTEGEAAYYGFVVRQGVMTDVNTLVQPGLAGPISYLRADQQGTMWGFEESGYFLQRLVAVVPNDPISKVAVSAGAVTGSPGAAIDGVVGTFADDRADAAAGDFTVVIDWGDGATTYGTAVRRADGGWDVVGSHPYAAAGAYRTTVTVADEVGGGYQSSAGSAKVVAPIVAGQTRWSAQGRSVGTLTTFSQAGSSVGEFTAVIHWGDGTTSAGVIVEDPNVPGQYVVLGYHTYDGGRVKDFLVTVEIFGKDGSSAGSSVGVSLK